MANIYGTTSGETLNGTLSSDNIYGYGGSDTINASNGNDYVSAGDGSDIVDGGTGTIKSTVATKTTRLWGTWVTTSSPAMPEMIRLLAAWAMISSTAGSGSTVSWSMASQGGIPIPAGTAFTTTTR